MIDLNDALKLAVSAAHSAGEILKSRFKTELNVQTKTSERDLVTEVDKAAQDAVIKIIQDAYPDHRFIAEEDGAKNLGDANCPYTWIIDPLDGTTNFVHKKPEHATMIALQENDELILGVIYYPSADRMFTGIKGGGAFIDGKPVQLRETKNMLDAVLCTCMLQRAEKSPDGRLMVPIPDCSSVHNYGCAAYELGDVLLGRNDGAFFEHVGFWDVAAGCLMISEAGGKHRIELDQKDPRKVAKCVASTPKIFDELCDFLW
jgi:myo-inositol-1(or 4)-monophosphatase